MLEMKLVDLEDSEGILAVYTPYIKNTAITFETEVPTKKDFWIRVKTISDKYPYLVVKDGDEIIGYAYASPFHERAAYKWDVDWSVYIKEEYHGKHIATILFDALKDCLKELGYLRIYSLVTSANDGSIKMHDKLGFKKIGVWEHTGYKFDTWYDVTLFDYEIMKEDHPKEPLVPKQANLAEIVKLYSDKLKDVK